MKGKQAKEYIIKSEFFQNKKNWDKAFTKNSKFRLDIFSNGLRYSNTISCKNRKRKKWKGDKSILALTTIWKTRLDARNY